jgi:hypothetical protein
MTKQEWTFEAMNSAYIMSNGKINEAYLNDTLCIYVMNYYPIYQALMNKRIKTHSVAWMALMYDANTRLQWGGYKATCSSAQLKKWLEMYGNGYRTINETVIYVHDQRLELMEERYDEKI